MIRIGAVRYLNSKPLLEGLADEESLRVEVDYPSRLAERLTSGELDVALIPSVEVFRGGGRVVSNACVACRGNVHSVKLYGRVPAEKIQRLAIDEGSRTSAALARILLAEKHNIFPQIEPFFLESSVADSDADAVLVIGDRAMKPPPGEFEFIWDLGSEWTNRTNLPFVFAVWAAQHPLADAVIEQLEAARDRGLECLTDISDRESRLLAIPAELARQYLISNLHFTLEDDELRGLELFRELCVKHKLAPGGTNFDCRPRRNEHSTTA